MSITSGETMTPYAGEWKKTGEPSSKVKDKVAAIRNKIKIGTRPAEALRDAATTETVPKEPENIDIAAASKNISALMAEAQHEKDAENANRITVQGKKLGFESAPKPMATPITETKPTDFEAAQSEITRMQENPTATINPDLSQEVKTTVMNSVLSGEAPIKVSTPTEIMKEAHDKEWATFIDKQKQAKEFYDKPPADREKNEPYHTYLARTNFIKSPPENYIIGETWNDYVLRGGPEELNTKTVNDNGLTADKITNSTSPQDSEKVEPSNAQQDNLTAEAQDLLRRLDHGQTGSKRATGDGNSIYRIASENGIAANLSPNDIIGQLRKMSLEQKNEKDTVSSEKSSEPAPALTKDAQGLLNKIDAGGVPSVITNNLRQIAQENGIVVMNTTTPDKIITALREKLNAASIVAPEQVEEAQKTETSEAPTEEPATPSETPVPPVFKSERIVVPQNEPEAVIPTETPDSTTPEPTPTVAVPPVVPPVKSSWIKRFFGM